LSAAGNAFVQNLRRAIARPPPTTNAQRLAAFPEISGMIRQRSDNECAAV
jgi:hypothetical protein